MEDREIRVTLERYWLNLNDRDIVNEIYHDDVILEFPQSGERFVGLANVRGFREVYPANVTMTTRRLRNGGTLWVAEHLVSYDGGRPVNGVSIMEFRGDKIAHETIYVGEPWDPPAWRAQWAEPVE